MPVLPFIRAFVILVKASKGLYFWLVLLLYEEGEKWKMCVCCG
jgi:hypothetical protein